MSSKSHQDGCIVALSGIVGDPAAIVNSTTNMNIFYINGGSNLINEYWTNTGGWQNQTLP